MSDMVVTILMNQNLYFNRYYVCLCACVFLFLLSSQREVRELCDQRVDFFQSLQESELKTAPSAASQ